MYEMLLFIFFLLHIYVFRIYIQIYEPLGVVVTFFCYNFVLFLCYSILFFIFVNIENVFGCVSGTFSYFANINIETMRPHIVRAVGD